jgi:glycosyltransferase involved in cell wall biosynthesis
LIAVSNGTGEQLKQMNPAVRVDVIGNGIDQRALKVPWQLGTDVLYIGRLEFAGKGMDLLLKAWALASPKIEGNLLIAGTGPDEQAIRNAVVAANVSDRVQFLGWVSGQEKLELLAAARIVVVPSRAETFGLVAVEALATGTPVIAFDIDCLREIVPPGCGWVVPPFDVTALAAEMVKRYGGRAELAATAVAGRKFAASFRWDALACRQLEAYCAALPLETARSGTAWRNL